MFLNIYSIATLCSSCPGQTYCCFLQALLPIWKMRKALSKTSTLTPKMYMDFLHPKERSRDYLLYRHERTEADLQTGALPDRPLVWNGNTIIGRISEGDLPQWQLEWLRHQNQIKAFGGVQFYVHTLQLRSKGQDYHSSSFWMHTRHFARTICFCYPWKNQ